MFDTVKMMWSFRATKETTKKNETKRNVRLGLPPDVREDITRSSKGNSELFRKIIFVWLKERVLGYPMRIDSQQVIVNMYLLAVAPEGDTEWLFITLSSMVQGYSNRWLSEETKLVS